MTKCETNEPLNEHKRQGRVSAVVIPKLARAKPTRALSWYCERQFAAYHDMLCEVPFLHEKCTLLSQIPSSHGETMPGEQKECCAIILRSPLIAGQSDNAAHKNAYQHSRQGISLHGYYWLCRFPKARMCDGHLSNSLTLLLRIRTQNSPLSLYHSVLRERKRENKKRRRARQNVGARGTGTRIERHTAIVVRFRQKYATACRECLFEM